MIRILRYFYNEISTAIKLEIITATFAADILEFVTGELAATVFTKDCRFLNAGIYLYTFQGSAFAHHLKVFFDNFRYIIALITN
ncbi:hypothetical protein CIY_24560 [Butyrivibrio fibrisolvens 16/4]|nr:hypothetical protein CIY_24560 [Butyrivibrio fibrisolvens 16/4]